MPEDTVARGDDRPLPPSFAAMCAPVQARIRTGPVPNQARDRALALVARLGPGQAPPPGLVQTETPRILIVRPDHLGDVLFTSPVVGWLHALCPQAVITYLAGPWSAEAAERLPGVVHVWPYPLPGFARTGRPGLLGRLRPYLRLWWLARRLRGERFDLAINLRPDFWWGAALIYLAGIPRRLGYALPACAPFLTHALPRPVPGHAVEHNLALAELALAELGRSAPGQPPPPITLVPTAADRAEAARLWRLHGLDRPSDNGRGETPPVLVVAPGAGSLAKLWPLERWALVIDHLAGRFGLRCVITGTGAEGPLADRLAAALSTPAAILTGQTPVGVLADLLRRCRMALGPDNGALHLAAAVGLPTVRLYGPADPTIFGPRNGSASWHAVVQTPRGCAGCGYLDLPPVATGVYPCMAELAAEAVIEAALGVWAASAERAAPLTGESVGSTPQAMPGDESGE